MSTSETQLSLFSAKPYYEPRTEPLDLTTYNRQKIETFDSEPGVTKLPARFEEGIVNNLLPLTKVTPVDEVYYQPAFTSAELKTGLRLLSECLRFVESAIEAARRSRVFEADDAVHHVQV